MLLADVAMLRLDGLANLGVVFDFVDLGLRRRQWIGSREHRTPAQFPDAGLVQNGLFPLHLLLLVLADAGFDESALLFRVRLENLACRLPQPRVFLRRQARHQGAIGGRLLQGLEGGAQLLRHVISAHLRQNHLLMLIPSQHTQTKTLLVVRPGNKGISESKVQPSASAQCPPERRLAAGFTQPRPMMIAISGSASVVSDMDCERCRGARVHGVVRRFVQFGRVSRHVRLSESRWV